MSSHTTYCHIKMKRPDGKSAHMDEALCGNVTGAYDEIGNKEEFEALKIACLDSNSFPLCKGCEEIMEARQ